MEDPPEARPHVLIRSVREWPDEHLRRAHRLLAMELREAIRADDGSRISSAEEESLMFGRELLRRGLI